jgi:hypothetical protein
VVSATDPHGRNLVKGHTVSKYQNSPEALINILHQELEKLFRTLDIAT